MKPETIKAIENILAKGERVLIIPIKDGYRIKRETLEEIAVVREPGKEK